MCMLKACYFPILHGLCLKLGQGEGQWRDDASSGSSTGAPGPLPTSQAPLPPIGQTYTQLTPIGEASREHTQAFSLPVNERDGRFNIVVIYTFK